MSLEVPKGSLTALLGPSGSGKSTLLRIIAGLELPDTGAIFIDERDVTFARPQERAIGFVFQHYAAFAHMSVRENVAFGLRIRKRPKEEIKAKVDELLALVGLTAWGGQRPAQLSGGQRQRMALARALAVEPQVLLLDEPFGALDANVRTELRQWLRRLHDEQGVTTVLVTHDQEEAMEVADKLAVMNVGQIEQVGSPREVYDKPASEFVMGFIGPVSKLEGRLVRPHDVSILHTPEPGTIEAMVRARRASRLRGANRARAPGRRDRSRPADALSDRGSSRSLAATSSTSARPPARRRPAWSTRNPGLGIFGQAVDRAGQLAAGDVGQGHVLDHAAEVGADGDPDTQERLGGAGVGGILGRAAADAGQRALHSADHVGHGELGRRAWPAGSHPRRRDGCGRFRRGAARRGCSRGS